MGHGPARELSRGDEREVELNPELASRLDAALERLDRLDGKFRAAREEERFAQSSKLWHRTCAELDEHLRTLGKVLIRTHQLNLDIGCEGGGVKAMPWMEEMGQAFDRLLFKLDGNEVVAFSGSRTLLRGPVRSLTYEWVERAVAEWVVASVEHRTS